MGPGSAAKAEEGILRIELAGVASRDSGPSALAAELPAELEQVGDLGIGPEVDSRQVASATLDLAAPQVVEVRDRGVEVHR